MLKSFGAKGDTYDDIIIRLMRYHAEGKGDDLEAAIEHLNAVFERERGDDD